jgi:hypothetical protein
MFFNVYMWDEADVNIIHTFSTNNKYLVLLFFDVSF